MTTSPDTPPTRWPLARVLILLLAAAYLGLMADIRVEHIDIVRHTWKGWIPIAYAAFMTLACLLAAFAWNHAARYTLLPLFLASFIVGGLGFYFHNQHRLAQLPEQTLSAWTDLNMKRIKGPPELAPLAFAGLGFLGTLASLKRFNPEDPIPE